MISTQTESRIIIPANQQLYTKSGRVIGMYFDVKGNPVTAITDPKNKFKIDKKFVTSEGFRRTETKSNLVNHIHYLIMDELDIYNKKEYDIYCTSLHSVLERLQSKKININKRVKNGYLYKYFPKFKMIINQEKWEKEIREKKYILDKNEYIIDLVNNTKCTGYCDCNILQTVFHLDTNKPFNLMNLYLFLRKKLDEELVFIKYRDYEWDEPYISIYKPAVEENIISKRLLASWIYDKKRVGDFTKLTIPIKGLQIKHYLYEIEGVKKYITISFYDTGSIDIKISFIEDKHANIPELEKTVSNFANVIKKINKVLNLKIPTPSLKFNKKEGRICLNNIEFNFLNVATKFREPVLFSPDDFSEFI